MSTTLTLPKANIPIGTVTIDGVPYDVQQHPEFVRFFYDSQRRAGGTVALTNVEISNGVASLDSDAQMARSDPVSQEAMRAVDELRNEFSSLRSNFDGLRSLLDEREIEFAGLRAVSDLRPRVEQLEDRLT